MSTNTMVHTQERPQGHGPVARAAADPREGSRRGVRRIGNWASNVGGVVRDTVCVTYDALRGRYDR